MDRWSLLAHRPYARVGEAAECARLESRGAPGERIALSFDIACFEGRVDATVAPTALVHAQETIAARDVDAYVVAVRDQAGIGVHRASRIAVHELLLKDDRAQPTGGYSRFCGHWRHLHRLRHGRRFYRAPALRLSGNAVASVGVAERKQIWITVRLRPDLSPGRYCGSVNVVDSCRDAGLSIPLTIEVLPLELREPWQRRMLWFRGTLDCRRPQFYVDDERFLQQLRDIRAHGFNAISLGETRMPLLRRALALARLAGFSDFVVLQPPFPAGMSRADLDGFDPVSYVSDEIDQRGPSWFPFHQQNALAADRLGFATMTSLVRERFTSQFSPSALGRRPDLVSLYLPSNSDFFKAGETFAELRVRETLYYWMASMEKPNVHRVLAGFYLWKSKADGISPYCYQHLPQFPYLPYDDFDEWEPDSRIGADRAPLKDQLATYPARSGSVPTLQWEGLGEGLTDLRYLATVEELLKEAETCHDRQVEQVRAGVEKRLRVIADAIPLSPIQIADDIIAEPYAHLGASDYDRFRRTLTDDALALSQALVDASSRRHEPTAASRSLGQ